MLPSLVVTALEADRAVAEAAQTVAGQQSRIVPPAIAAMVPYAPGKPWRAVAEELGLDPNDLLMLAANENVLGPSEKAAAAAAAAMNEVHLYPDGGAHALKAALAERHGVTPQHVVVGNGSNEIIELLIRTFVGLGETVVTAWPSFVVYRLITQAASREALLAPLRQDRYDLSGLAQLVDARTKLVFISNPNNPTGTYVSRREVAAFLDRIPRSVIVVLDEAYHEYVEAEDCPDGTRDFRGYPRMVVLRTFSKIYGLAGLRVGYGIMDPSLVQYLDRVRQPYNVGTAAQAAALAALGDDAHVRKSWRLARDGRKELTEGLTKLGFQVVPSQTNFVLVRLGFPALPVVEALRPSGILVRDMRGYDMPDTIRLTIGTRAMNLRVLEVLQGIVEEVRASK